jgi:hypothetical protein
MARVFTEGFEMGDILFISSTAGTVAAATDQARSGLYSLKLTGNAASATRILTTALSEFYTRFGFRLTSYGLATNQFFNWYKDTNLIGHIRLNGTTRRVEIYSGTGTLLTTGAIALSLDTWYLFEFRIKIDDSTGAIELKIDGVSDATYAGDTKPGSDTNVNALQWRATQTGQIVYVDDLALNDTNGASDNSWCGDGKIVAVWPDGNGDASQLTGSDGNSTDNYLLVDDVPKDDDTTYVASSTAGQYDLYNLGAVSLPAGYTINRIYAECRAREDAAAGDSIQLGIKPSGGSESWSASRAVTTSYARYVGSEHTVNPADSGAWEAADINALQAGPKVV